MVCRSISLSTLAICIFYIALVFFLYKIVVIDNNKTFLIISEDHFCPMLFYLPSLNLKAASGPP